MSSPKHVRSPRVDADQRGLDRREARGGAHDQFHYLARGEVLEIASWASLHLIELLDAAIVGISAMPAAWTRWPGRAGVHQRVLRKLRHSVIYTFDAEAVSVVAVAHHRRRPGYWLSRLG